MCGIAGILSPDPSLISNDILHNMAFSVKHRGPDGEACWINTSGNVGFAHRRLSVIDTSIAAAQPMHFAGRYTIVYNGEIYNYQELRATLAGQGIIFNTSSDTEVILAMYHIYKKQCLGFFDGMFSFAIWDEREQLLFCARDRFGEKPFYYHHSSAAFYFGSEIKVLKAAGIYTSINHSLLLQFIANGRTSDGTDPGKTFSNTICKLPAAHFLTYDYRENSISVTRYWEINKNACPEGSEKAIIEQFSELFFTSVRRRLRSDVSVGTSLSGGLDSAAVAAAIAVQVQSKVFKTFTAFFPGFDKDESVNARAVAERLGFEHYMVAPAADDLADNLRKIMHHQEEPFSSASVYAQYRVFELAKQHDVVVLLDGQGADELLAGYEKYRSWRIRSVFPQTTAAILKQKAIMRMDNNKNIHPHYLNAWRDEEKITKPVVRVLNDMLHFDIFGNALEELLRYADRNSMAHSREVRLPFLNHDLANFVFSLPANYKIRQGFTKWILRMSVNNYLPEHIVWNRKKIGFEPPQKNWMQQERMKDLLHESKIKLVKEGILRSEVLKKPSVAHGAYDKNTEAWRYITTAMLWP